MKMFILGMVAMHFLMFFSFWLMEGENEITQALGALLCGPILWYVVIQEPVKKFCKRCYNSWNYRAIMLDKQESIYVVKRKYVEAMKAVYDWKLPEGDLEKQLKQEWVSVVGKTWMIPNLIMCPYKMWKSYPAANMKDCRRAFRIYFGVRR